MCLRWRVSRSIFSLRNALESPGGGLKRALCADVEAHAAGFHPPGPWRLGRALTDQLVYVLGSERRACVALESLSTRARDQIERAWILIHRRSDRRREFVVEFGWVFSLHHAMYAAEAALGRRVGDFWMNYASQLAALCDALEVRRRDLEGELLDEICAWRNDAKVKFRIHTRSLLHELERAHGVDDQCVRRMVEAATTAKIEALKRWAPAPGRIPARLLAQYLFLLMRHVALSAWENRRFAIDSESPYLDAVNA